MITNYDQAAAAVTDTSKAGVPGWLNLEAIAPPEIRAKVAKVNHFADLVLCAVADFMDAAYDDAMDVDRVVCHPDIEDQHDVIGDALGYTAIYKLMLAQWFLYPLTGGSPYAHYVDEFVGKLNLDETILVRVREKVAAEYEAVERIAEMTAVRKASTAIG